MERGRRDGWETNYEVYSPNQVEAVLEHAGVEVVSETHTHFLAYCPFHGNSDTPAFAVDKEKGLWTCFNPSCMTSGKLEELLRRLKGLNPFQALRVISKNRDANGSTFQSRLSQAVNKPPVFTEFPQASLDRMREDFPDSVGERYMKERHFTDETLQYFEVGYSYKKNMVVVPMHDPDGMPIGIIGRTPSHREEDKRFKNSANLPKSLTAWNFHRAKKTGDTVIICEASYDAMRIHQAGYPNVIALLGGHITQHHADQIGRSFSTIVIMTDFDSKQKRANCRLCSHLTFGYNEIRCEGHRPGRDLGRQIVKILPNKKILWAAYDDSCVYPAWPLEGYRRKPAKDASDMTDQEIRQCLRGAVSNLQYVQLDLEEKHAASLA